MHTSYDLKKPPSRIARWVFWIIYRLRRFLQIRGRFRLKEVTLYFNPKNPIEYERYTSLLTKEPGTIDWIDNQLKHGDVFIDIGANVGVFGIYAAATKSGVRVFSFEPQKATFATLLENIALNHQIDCHQATSIALSNHSNLHYLNYSGQVSGKSGSQIETTSPPKKLSELVMTQSFDQLLDSGKLPLPNLIKIDVDGLEYDILKGMKKTLTTSNPKPSLQVEINPGEEARIDMLMEEFGYVEQSTHLTPFGERQHEKGIALSQIHVNRIYAPIDKSS